MKSWKIRKSELYKKRGQVFQVEETVIKKAIRQATLVTFQGLLEDQCGLRTVGEKENHSENWERVWFISETQRGNQCGSSMA